MSALLQNECMLKYVLLPDGCGYTLSAAGDVRNYCLLKQHRTKRSQGLIHSIILSILALSTVCGDGRGIPDWSYPSLAWTLAMQGKHAERLRPGLVPDAPKGRAQSYPASRNMPGVT